MELSVSPHCSLTLKKAALAVEFCPFEWASSLLAVGHSSSVAVYSVEERDSNKEESNKKLLQFSLIWECYVANEPACLSWSPSSTLRSVDKCVQLLVATRNHSVVLLTSDLKESNTEKEVCEHSDYINSIALTGESDNLTAASTGDDLTAKVWNCCSGIVLAKFFLTSPGMAVKFHPEDEDVLLVGERSGILRVYSLSQNCVKLTLRSHPILSVDWSFANPCQVAACGPQGIYVWDLLQQRLSRNTQKVAGGDCVSKIVVCPSNPDVAAVTTASNFLCITSLFKNKIPITANLKVISDITWHSQLPFLAVASDGKILFWKSENV